MKKLWPLLFLAVAAHAQVTYPGTIKKASQYSDAYYSAAGSSYTISGLAAPTTPNGVPQIPCTTPSGGAATAPVNCLPGIAGRALTGTTATDTILATDCNPYRVTYITSVNVAVTLPTATTFGVPNCTLKIVNGTSGANTTVTITPTTWTISAGGGGTGSSLVLQQGQEAIIFVDPNNATNWVADVFEQGITAGVGVKSTRSSSGMTLSNSVQSYNSGSISASVGVTNVATSANFPTGQYTLSCDVAVTAVGSVPTLAVTIGWTDITGTARTKTCTTGVVTVSDNPVTQTVTSNGSAAITVTQTLAVSTATWWTTVSVTRNF